MREWDAVCRDLNLFGGMIFNACRMPMWCFALDGHFFCATSPNEKEFRLLLEHSGCLAYALSPERRRDRPVYLSDNLGLTWVADYAWNETGPVLLILMGPVFSSESSLKGIEDALRKMDFSIQMRNNFIQKLKTVTVMNYTLLEQYAAMLHHIISGEVSVNHDYEYQADYVTTEWPKDSEDKIDVSGMDTAEDSDVMGIEYGRMMEACIMKAIREGNISFDMDKMTVNDGHKPSGVFIEVDHYNKGEINRDEKNTVIIFAALCARAAMDGGLSPKTVKQMQLMYIRRIEETKSLTELMALNMTMLNDFIQKVHESQTNPDISRTIQYCCDYIQKNLMVPFELSDMSREVGYAEYYLTKKFHKEMGISLTDYIKNARIEMAKILLMTTDQSIDEISNRLCFNSRGYFGRIFKEKVGVTPASYREKTYIERKR